MQLIANAFRDNPVAVWALVTHGQVYIDGHCVQPSWLEALTAERLEGRVVKCPRGELRVVGGRLIRDHEQMELC